MRLFDFDPNTITEQQWQELGIRDRTIKTIMNYLSKGGAFRKKEDLQKIYGLHSDEYERLAPYIKIVKRENAVASNNYGVADKGTSNERQFYSAPRKKAEVVTIDDINTANAEAFIALPGIGEKLAARIINFRDKLGGFCSVDQVKETYGLPDSTFQLVRPFLKLSSSVKKININTATKDEFKLHPYIRWNIGNAIVEYRNQHGVYKSLDELKKIVVIDEQAYTKMLPYLSL